MKIIDLFNKIANGETMPKRICYKTWIFIYVDNFYGYMKENYLTLSQTEPISLMAYIVSMGDLNDEVEIIEDTPKEGKVSAKDFLDNQFKGLYLKEYKKIEKLENKIDTTFENATYSERMILTEIINKINEIIDKVNGE